MISNISDLASSSLSTAPESTVKEESTLGQDEFLELMLTQIRHQDPFKPTDNGEFITQMAQFSQVTSTDSMRTSLEKFVEDQSTAQLLNAASLIGRKAMIDSNQGTLTDNNEIVVEYELPQPTDELTATITDDTGAVVHTINAGSAGSGTHSLQWDGTTSNGTRAGNGRYTINIQYVDTTGESVAAPVTMSVDVESVNVGVNGTGLTMTSSDGRDVRISDVRKFL